MDLVGPRLFGPRGIQVAPWAANPTPYFLMAGIGFPGSSPLRWAQLLMLAPSGQFLWTLGAVAVGALLVLASAILIAGAKTRRSWQQELPSARRLWFRAKFCTPVLWLGLFRRWMRRKLERNPIGWLEQRTWTGRMVTWAWFGIIIALFSAALDDPKFLGEYYDLQTKIAWLLAGSIAVSAAASFRRERMSGVLELLLISPVRESEILLGRLCGLWAQFLPTALLLLGIWVYFSSMHAPDDGEGAKILFFVTTFFALPVIGRYFSLLCRNFIVGFLWSLAVGLLVPIVLPLILGILWQVFIRADWNNDMVFVTGRAALVQVVLAGLLGWRMERRLRTRRFPLERTAQ
jgi:ABC-type transport system involved in cytochrome c biogenesis permease component